VFAKEIYHPLREEIDKLNNDNDLFMRSLNLAKVAEKKLPDSMKAAASVGKKSGSTAKSGGRRSGSSGTAKGASVRRRYTDDEKYAEAACYLRKGTKLTEVEEVCLGVNNSGSTAKSHLNKLGIDTSDNSQHKGMLSDPNSIDDAIANAADDTLKRTLKEIKERGLHLKY
jgi:DNA invertase Pin-like site-specific DNA recombinase